MPDLTPAQQLDLRANNGDVSAAVVPTDRLTPITNPYPGENSVPSLDLFYFFPAECLWSASAQGFAQLKGVETRNSALHYQHLIDHIFFIAGQIGDVDDKQIVTWTTVPKANDANEHAGFLVRCTYNNMAAMEVLEKMNTSVKQMTVFQKASMMKGNSDKWAAMPGFKRFTYDAFTDVCTFYSTGQKRQQLIERRGEGLQDFHLPRNPYNPCSVFNCDTAIEKMKHAKADPDFLQRFNYITAAENVVYPREGKNTYRLPSSKLNPARMARIHLPHIPHKEITLDNVEFRAFVRDAGGAAEDGDIVMGEDGERMKYLNELMELFSRMCASTDGDSSNNLQSFKKRVAKEKGKCRRACGGDLRKFAHMWRETQLKLIRIFMRDIFTTDETADCGDSLKALAAWYQKRVTGNPKCSSFMMYNKKFSHNLSRFGDAVAQDAAGAGSAE